MLRRYGTTVCAIFCSVKDTPRKRFKAQSPSYVSFVRITAIYPENTTKFKQVSHVWQVDELLSEIQVSLRYWLEEDICDDLSECEMNREAVCARDREGVARTENALG